GAQRVVAVVRVAVGAFGRVRAREPVVQLVDDVVGPQRVAHDGQVVPLGVGVEVKSEVRGGGADVRRRWPRNRHIDLPRRCPHSRADARSVRPTPRIRPGDTSRRTRLPRSAMRYWHSLFLQVRYSSMDNAAQTPSGIPLQPVYGPADRSVEPPPP